MPFANVQYSDPSELQANLAEPISTKTCLELRSLVSWEVNPPDGLLLVPQLGATMGRNEQSLHPSPALLTGQWKGSAPPNATNLSFT